MRVYPRHAHFGTRRQLRHQPVQRPQPRRIQHRPRPRLDDTQHVGGIAADRSRRAIGQIDHQQQHTVPPFERLRRQQPTKQRVRLGHYPHLTRQDSTQLLQSVAFTSGTGKSHLLIALGTAGRAKPASRSGTPWPPQLVNELVEAADDKQLSKTIARYGRVDLLCIDELGYMELDPRLCAAILDRLTFGGNIIETGTTPSA